MVYAFVYGLFPISILYHALQSGVPPVHLSCHSDEVIVLSGDTSNEYRYAKV